MRDRILLNVLVKRGGMGVTGAALHLGMVPSWGTVKNKRSRMLDLFLNLN